MTAGIGGRFSESQHIDHCESGLLGRAVGGHYLRSYYWVLEKVVKTLAQIYELSVLQVDCGIEKQEMDC